MTNWHDQNIKVLNSSPAYDPAKPMKRWVDNRALDSANTEPSFVYNKLVQGKLTQFTLLRKDAAEVNIPPVGAAETNNTTNWNRTEVPIPVRDLELGESIVTDPFGQVIITQEADRAVKLSDLALIHSEIKHLRKMLQDTRRGNPS